MQTRRQLKKKNNEEAVLYTDSSEEGPERIEDSQQVESREEEHVSSETITIEESPEDRNLHVSNVEIRELQTEEFWPEIDMRTMMIYLQTMNSNLNKKMDENRQDIKNIEKNLDKKMDKIDKNMEKKLDENSKKMQENYSRLEKKLQNKLEDTKQEIHLMNLKIDEGQKKLKKKIEDVTKENMEKLQNVEKKVEEQLEVVLNDCSNRIEVERIERITELEKTKEDVGKQIEEIKIDVQVHGQHVQNIDYRWREAIMGHDGYIREKLGEQEESLKKNIEEKLQENIKKMEEINMRNYPIGRIFSNFNSNEHLKFSGYLKKLHPIVFVNSIKNKIRYLNNFEDIKDLLRQNLTDSALVWYSSIEDTLQDFLEFENKFLGYFWGESAQAEFRETLYFGKFIYEKSNDFVNYALRLFTVAKYLKPAMNEEDIILNIARHFKPEVIETITVNNIKTMAQLTNYLNRFQRGNKRVTEYRTDNEYRRIENRNREGFSRNNNNNYNIGNKNQQNFRNLPNYGDHNNRNQFNFNNRNQTNSSNQNQSNLSNRNHNYYNNGNNYSFNNDNNRQYPYNNYRQTNNNSGQNNNNNVSYNSNNDNYYRQTNNSNNFRNSNNNYFNRDRQNYDNNMNNNGQRRVNMIQTRERRGERIDSRTINQENQIEDREENINPILARSEERIVCRSDNNYTQDQNF